MNKFNKTLISLALLGSTSMAFAEISVTPTLATDYLFRGVSQTDSGLALQVGLDYAHDNGFYAGVWGSNVDFGDDATAEIDFFVGYGAEISETMSYDITYNYYTYGQDYDYGEFLANLYVNSFTLGFAYTPDYAQTGDAAQYISGAYDLELPHDIALTLQAGYSMGDAFDGYEYVDYSATFAKTMADFDFSAALVNTDIEDDDTADARIVLSVSRSF